MKRVAEKHEHKGNKGVGVLETSRRVTEGYALYLMVGVLTNTDPAHCESAVRGLFLDLCGPEEATAETGEEKGA